MFNSVKQVHDGFFKHFRPSVHLEIEGLPALNVNVEYGRHSNKSYKQKEEESYPKIIILDKAVSPSDNWNRNGREQLLGEEDTSGDGNIDSVEITQEPIQLDCIYQVSAYFSQVDHKWAYQDWFYSKFNKFGGLIFNGEIVEQFEGVEEEVGQMVTYKMSMVEIDRTDGIFELDATFTMQPFVYLGPSELSKLITTFNQRFGVK